MGDNITPFPSFTKKWHTTAYGALDPTLPALLATGKNVVITGGGTGIGAATALRFAQAGASSISILGRRPSPLTSTKSFIQASIPTAKIYTHVTDVTQKDSVTTTFKMIHESLGEIHVFVNNAGYASTPASIKDADSEDWWRGFEINIRGAFFATQAFLHFMAKDAVLVNISSAVTHILYGPNGSSYSASKEGAVRFFADVQLEHPEVRVVNLQPGTIETDMARKVGVKGRDDSSLPAAVIVWLASPEAAFLKGKYIWGNWDVGEMKARAEEIAGSDLLTMQLVGWPSAGVSSNQSK